MDELLVEAREEIKLAKEMMEFSEMLKKKEQAENDYSWESARRFEKEYEPDSFNDYDACIVEMDRNIIMLLTSATDKTCEYRHGLNRKGRKEKKVV